MYHSELLHHVENFWRKVFGGYKSQIFFYWSQNAGCGDRMAEGLVTLLRLGDSFAGPGGHSANLDAQRSFLWGSWSLCTPSFLRVLTMIFHFDIFFPRFNLLVCSKQFIDLLFRPVIGVVKSANIFIKPPIKWV